MTRPDSGPCPVCGGDVRFTVRVFVDAPLEYWHKLSKANLRAGDVKVTGVNWDSGMWYCERCGHVVMSAAERVKGRRGNE